MEGTFAKWSDCACTELSHEVILCFIEYNQFRSHLLKAENAESEGTDCIFHAAMPKSTIVHSVISYSSAESAGTDQMPPEMTEIPARSPSSIEDVNTTAQTTPMIVDAQTQRKAHCLYEKYVGTGATFEVNISSKLRHSLDELERNTWSVSGSVLIAAVDELIEGMFYYMRESFSRFVRQ